MSAPHLHLILNHAPLFGEIAAAILLASGALLRKSDVVAAGLLAAVMSGGLAVATFFSGRAAAEAIGRVEGVNQDSIGPHEEAAEAFTITAVICAVVAAAALRWSRVKLLAAVVIAAATVLGVYTADLGGRIHHPETLPARARSAAKPAASRAVTPALRVPATQLVVRMPANGPRVSSSAKLAAADAGTKTRVSFCRLLYEALQRLPSVENCSQRLTSETRLRHPAQEQPRQHLPRNVRRSGSALPWNNRNRSGPEAHRSVCCASAPAR